MMKFISLFFIICLLSACNGNKLWKVNKNIFQEKLPDEFAVEKNEPLKIPKEFNLPKPIIPDLVSSQKLDKVNKENLSKGENEILNKTKDYNANGNIYEKIDKKPNILERIF